MTSKYSCVAPGPPWSSSTLMRGLLPTRLVHTRNVPLGVVIGIMRAPPLQASGRPVVSKYAAEGPAFDGVVVEDCGAHDVDANATSTRAKAVFMECPPVFAG